MAKFKKGDRVVLVGESIKVPTGSIGTVQEDDTVPDVLWDEPSYNINDRGYYAIAQGSLELVKEDKMVFGTKVIDRDGAEAIYLGEYRGEVMILDILWEDWDDEDYCMNGDSVWLRDPRQVKLPEAKKKMTVAEVCEKLGYDIEIVKG